MKAKFLIIMLAVLLPAFQEAKAGAVRDSIEVRGLRVSVDGDSLRVCFRAEFGEHITGGRDYKLTLRPVLVGATSKQVLRPIEVYGRRVKILNARSAHPRVAGLAANDLRHPFVGALHAEEGSTVEYAASLPLERWMEGAQLRMERFRSGCCRTEQLGSVLLASDVVEIHSVDQEPLLSRAADLVQVVQPISTGDSLAHTYAFVEPVSALETYLATSHGLFDLDMPLNMGKGTESASQSELEKFIAAGEKGALKVHFRQGKSLLERHFMDNNAALVNLLSSISTIMNSPSSRVVRVVIVGSASPEGTLAFNDRLAWNRALSLKEFIGRNTEMSPDSIRLFNGSEDWRGLREQVAKSDLYEKAEILRIIDNVPVKGGRELELMKLAGGRPYLYMLEYMFPDLRNAAFIKVYYENVPDAAAEALAEGAALIAARRYEEALQTLRTATPGVYRDFLQGVGLYCTGSEAEALPLLERAAEGGEPAAVEFLNELQRQSEPRTFGHIRIGAR